MVICLGIRIDRTFAARCSYNVPMQFHVRPSSCMQWGSSIYSMFNRFHTQLARFDAKTCQEEQVVHNGGRLEPKRNQKNALKILTCGTLLTFQEFPGFDPHPKLPDNLYKTSFLLERDSQV